MERAIVDASSRDDAHSGAPVSQAEPIDSPLTDGQLLDRLRGGDSSAYEELWLRHVGAARRAASRIAPADQEDLVSEAFLAIYRQVLVDGKGPQTSFRAYLFTVMRNIAARWYREGRPLVSDPEADATVDEGGYERVEREHDDAQLLDAFRALPARWQRVLWLSEVEEAARPTIAAEFGIGANAVSALQRRARGGLREQWLAQQLPKALREDAQHVAAALPARVVTGKSRDPLVDKHLAVCDQCRRAETDLRLAYGNGRGAAASISGLAALGVILPSATAVWAAPASVSVAAGVGLTVLGSAAAAVGALMIGLGTGFIPLPFSFPGGAQAIEAVLPSPVAAAPIQIPVLPSAVPAPGPVQPTLPGVSLPEEPAPIDFWVPSGPITGLPTRPAPTPAAPGSVLPPAGGGTTPGTGTPPSAPVVTTSAPASTYMAPIMSGTAPADSTVAVRVDDAVYTVAPAPDGSWAFDARALSLPAGDYTAEVWTVRAGTSSPAASLPFTITSVTVSGFEGDVLMDLDSASTTGLVFTLTGPASGTACVSSDVGQTATLPLSADGTVTRRIRFLTTGFYALSFSTCDDGYTGPSTDESKWVSTGIFDPWDDVPYFELDEVTDPATGSEPAPETGTASGSTPSPEPTPTP